MWHIIRGLVGGLWLLSFGAAQAANPPLVIAVAHYTPPFVFQGANNSWTGFDISMMNYICTTLQRRCVYKALPFANLFPALVNQQADVAVSAITITLARAKDVNFSESYLVSQSRFLGPSELAKQPFSLNLLVGKQIGVERGTIFAEQIQTMNINRAKIVLFNSEEDVIDALSKKQVDFALLDAPDASYWQLQSSNTLSALGSPISYGQGYGIAINPNQPALVNVINLALKAYLASPQYKQNYQIYFGAV